MTADGSGTGSHTYTWDAEGKMLSVATSGSSTASVTYDALGRAVEIAVGTQYTQVVYDPLGNKLALMSGQTLSKAFVPLPGGATAVYNASGLDDYRHPDWLGSSRFASTPNRTLFYDGAYAPYGENYAETGTQDRNFTGQNQDIVSSGPYPLYDFLMREYHPTWGRWVSPDPAGLAAADPSNPQSWNRYAYALNNPTNLTDPLGLDSDSSWLDIMGATIQLNIGWVGDGFGTTNWDSNPFYNCQFFEGANCGYVTWSPYYGNTNTSGGGNAGNTTTKPGSTPDINKTWSENVTCNKDAQQVMSAVQNDMGQFADNRGTIFAANFLDAPLTLGHEYMIMPGLNPHMVNGSIFPTGVLAVTVTSQSANGWTFTTDPAHHYFNGTVSFSATDAGNGNITFSVTANANYSSRFWSLFGPIIKAGENSTWNSLLGNVEGYCQSPVGN